MHPSMFKRIISGKPVIVEYKVTELLSGVVLV